jgi:hypothetical protein
MMFLSQESDLCKFSSNVSFEESPAKDPSGSKVVMDDIVIPHDSQHNVGVSSPVNTDVITIASFAIKNSGTTVVLGERGNDQKNVGTVSEIQHGQETEIRLANSSSMKNRYVFLEIHEYMLFIVITFGYMNAGDLSLCPVYQEMDRRIGKF